jgi:hypothetical protein
MSELPDGSYDAMVVDVDVDAHDDIARVELVITSGEHKGFVVPLRGRVTADVMGLPATITVEQGQVRVRFS